MCVMYAVVIIVLYFFQTEPDPRKMLYKLRITWTPYLSKHKLATLDRHVRTLDPKWPIVAVDTDSPTPTIFINPKFMAEGQVCDIILRYGYTYI